MNSNNLNDYSDLIVNFSHNLNNFCDLLVNFPQLNDRPTKDLRNLLVTSINITYWPYWPLSRNMTSESRRSPARLLTVLFPSI